MKWLIIRDSRAPERPVQLPLKRGRHSVGRDESNDIPLGDPEISRLHCLIQVGDEVKMTDLGSKNGTFVNGERTPGCSIKKGDSIRIGPYKLGLREAPPRDVYAWEEDDFDVAGEFPVPFLTVADLTTDEHLCYTIERDEITLGRQEDCDIPLQAAGVSRRHARIRREGDKFILYDDDSRNGVLIEGRRIDSRRLEPGDAFHIGPFELVFGLPPRPPE